MTADRPDALGRPGAGRAGCSTSSGSARTSRSSSGTVRGGRPLVYLDTGATSQKPRQVLDAERDFYERHNAAVHRGVHTLAEEATDALRGRARQGRGVHRRRRPDEVVFTKNATEAHQPRRVRVRDAATAGRAPASASAPATRSSSPRWSTTPTSCRGSCVAERTGATLRWFGAHRRRPARPRPTSTSVITERTKVVAFAHQSNVLGTVNPRRGDRRAGRARSARSSCSTRASRCRTCRSTCTALGVDFVAFSGHKMLGPTGIGVLWGRRELLEAMPPFLGGGAMIEMVTMEGSTYAAAAAAVRGRHAARSPQAVGLGAAVDYLTALGMDAVARARARAHRRTRSTRLPAGRRACGSSARRRPSDRGGAVSFVVDGVHPHDVGQVLDERGRRGARRPPLRLAAVPALRRAGDDPGVVLPLHDAGRGRRAGRRRSTHVAAFFGVALMKLEHDVPGDHPRPLPAPAPQGPARAVRRRGAPRQPDLRRRGDPAGAARDDGARSRTSPTTALGCSISRPRRR